MKRQQYDQSSKRHAELKTTVEFTMILPFQMLVCSVWYMSVYDVCVSVSVCVMCVSVCVWGYVICVYVCVCVCDETRVIKLGSKSLYSTTYLNDPQFISLTRLILLKYFSTNSLFTD